MLPTELKKADGFGAVVNGQGDFVVLRIVGSNIRPWKGTHR